MSNINFFSDEEVDLILEIISNIRYVSHSHLFVEFLKNKEDFLNEVVDKLLAFKKNKNTLIEEKYFPLINDILELSIKIYVDDDIQTYTGQTKHFIQGLANRLIFNIQRKQG